MSKRIVTTISYERYNNDRTQYGFWEIISKQFDTDMEAEKFIRRIRDNVSVGNIWKRKDLVL